MYRINLEALGAYLRTRDDVVFAVVFGSAADSVIPEDGDLDLGVLFVSEPNGEDRIRFMTQVAESVEFDVIDLVDLRHAGPILAFEALSGRFLCKNDANAAAAFTSLVCRRYEDTIRRLEYAA